MPLSAHGINFRYGENEPLVINDFSIEIDAGECVAIVGPSGAGKTTLLKILAGLLRPSKGMLMLDGIPVAAMGMEQYRAQIGCVLQDDRLFAGSIAENIAAFDPSPNPDRIQDAAKLAAIHQEVLRMPMGYETLVGDMGSSLSGGQLQRVVLARALYRSPRILLLDEATAHLDEENERVINTAIRSLPISRIIVAHRRSTIDMADRVVPIWPAQATVVSRQDNPHEASHLKATSALCRYRQSVPELNPQENIRQYMRDNWISNRVFGSAAALVDHCCDAWNDLENQPWTIVSIGMRRWAYRFCPGVLPF